jgi:hypothetical protein
MTNTELVSAETVIGQLYSIVLDGREEFRYDKPDWADPNEEYQCMYVHGYGYRDVRCGCIIGVLLHKKYDVPLAKFEAVEGAGASEVIPRLLPHVPFDPDALAVADGVQGRQDAGSSWIESVRQAELAWQTDLAARAEAQGMLGEDDWEGSE